MQPVPVRARPFEHRPDALLREAAQEVVLPRQPLQPVQEIVRPLPGDRVRQGEGIVDRARDLVRGEAQVVPPEERPDPPQRVQQGAVLHGRQLPAQPLPQGVGPRGLAPQPVAARGQRGGPVPVEQGPPPRPGGRTDLQRAAQALQQCLGLLRGQRAALPAGPAAAFVGQQRAELSLEARQLLPRQRGGEVSPHPHRPPPIRSRVGSRCARCARGRSGPRRPAARSPRGPVRRRGGRGRRAAHRR